MTARPTEGGKGAVAAQATVVTAGIVVVTHKYLVIAALLRWTPTIFDTLIPYLLGLGEIIAALAIGHEAPWWFAISFWLLCGVAALWHSALRARPEIFGSMTGFYRSFRRSALIQAVWCGALFVICLVVGLLDAAKVSPQWLNSWLIGAAAAGLLIIYLIGKKSSRDIYDTYGIPRMRR